MKKIKSRLRNRKSAPLQGLKPAVRMKGGVRYNISVKGFIAVVHSWDNELCEGEPQEWCSPLVFPTEEEAMEHYKTVIRPELERMSLKIMKLKNVEVFHDRLED